MLLFNRIFYVVFAMLVQLELAADHAFWRLAGYSRYMSIAIVCSQYSCVFWIVNKEINPSYKLAWTMLILVPACIWRCSVSAIWTIKNCDLYAGAVQMSMLERNRAIICRTEPDLQEQLRMEDAFCLQCSPTIYIRDSSFPVHGNTTSRVFPGGR